jgi:hypothetical protein
MELPTLIGYIEAFVCHLISDQINRDPVAEGDTFVERMGGVIKMGDSGIIVASYGGRKSARKLSITVGGKKYLFEEELLEAMAKDFEEFALEKGVLDPGNHAILF